MCRLRVPQRQRHEGHSESRPVVKFDRKSALAAAVMSTGTAFRQLSVEMLRGSPYRTDISTLEWPNL